ncbi:hypothetical protein BU16DRAFT_79993 [Lophium mytilinum]|uniref:Velvet domain-containing protein n=1 Tax=Lophium mytilinum TaxID=390894 RepID=A0A6A6QM29_9PEZI|nr:hypothetical protein BU16DRAFT_79993 [Lophium mytilinum]
MASMASMAYTYGHHQVYPEPPASSTCLPAPGDLPSEQYHLFIRQHPKLALLSTTGTEKNRKPVDPPPVVQLKIDQRVDPSQHYLNNPYLFMAVSLYKGDIDQDYEDKPGKSLAGSLTSSSHRLKDFDNSDCCFFVYSDISPRVPGTFRLKFTLFEFRKDAGPGGPGGPGVVVFRASIISDKFVVQSQKDFQGMEESTMLSRTFADQGVRLRLRKEPRTMIHKRNNLPFSPSSTPLAARRPSMDGYTQQGYSSTYFNDGTYSSGRHIDKRSRPNDYAQYAVHPYHYQYSPVTTRDYQFSSMSTNGLGSYNFSSGAALPQLKSESRVSTSGQSALTSDTTSQYGISPEQALNSLGQQRTPQQPVQPPVTYSEGYSLPTYRGSSSNTELSPTDNRLNTALNSGIAENFPSQPLAYRNASATHGDRGHQALTSPGALQMSDSLLVSGITYPSPWE